MRKKFFLTIIILSSIVLYLTFSKIQISYALSQYGSSGNEVRQIQTKLKQWGYYNGSIDGIYGTKTYEAIRKFQSSNGLTVDGIAGEKTLSALGITSSNNSSNGGKTNNNSDLNLLSHLVYAEARGEPYNGMVAVAATVMNRVSDSRFPNSVSGVIYQAGAYTCVSDGQINLQYNNTAQKAAQDAINGWDPTSRMYLLF
jgi:N-acetylmuramoyl-L-alanine amidase